MYQMNGNLLSEQSLPNISYYSSESASTSISAEIQSEMNIVVIWTCLLLLPLCAPVS